MRQKRRLFSAHFAFSLSLLAIGLSALSGCGDRKIARYPVKGVVRVDGQPVAGALVIFCPTEGPPELLKERPYGRTDAQGVYELRTLEPGDGAPAGAYKIMVRWLTSGASQGRGDDRAGEAGDRLRGRYTNPEQSGLTYTVIEEPNEVPPFELTAK
jgi:hypothetical protein